MASKGRSFSIRDHLSRQGVDTSEGMKSHLSFILSSLAVNPHLDLRSYRVSPSNPNVPDMG